MQRKKRRRPSPQCPRVHHLVPSIRAVQGLLLSVHPSHLSSCHLRLPLDQARRRDSPSPSEVDNRVEMPKLPSGPRRTVCRLLKWTVNSEAPTWPWLRWVSKDHLDPLPCILHSNNSIHHISIHRRHHRYPIHLIVPTLNPHLNIAQCHRLVFLSLALSAIMERDRQRPILLRPVSPNVDLRLPSPTFTAGNLPRPMVCPARTV